MIGVLRSSAARRATSGAVVVLALVGGARVLTDSGPGTGHSDRPASRAASAPEPATQDRAHSATGTGPLLDVETAAQAAAPANVRIPPLAVESGLDRIGVDAGGVLEPPPRWQVPAWFEGGPRPGEVGPAVIAGHVDSPTGPAVFAKLKGLRPDDRIEIVDRDGNTHVFAVDRLEQAPRREFPTEAVYGPTPDPQLRLITCDGDYLSRTGQYEDNLIVYATAVPS